MIHRHVFRSFCLGAALLGTSVSQVIAEDTEDCIDKKGSEIPAKSAASCRDAWLLNYAKNTEVVIGLEGQAGFKDAPALKLGQGICDGSWVTLRTEGKAEITVAGQEEPVHLSSHPEDKKPRCKKIEAAASGETSDSNGLFDDLVSIFASWAPRHYAPDADNFIMRGPEDPIDVAIMPTDVSKLVAGPRTVALLWSGGQPPYRLSISKDEVEIFAADAKQHALPTTEIVFDMGRHLLVISDAEGKTVERRIDVVAEAPEAPEKLAAAITNDGFSAVVRSGWLSTLDDGSWRWEAMLRVLPYARNDPAAAGLTRALLNGDHPVGLD